MPRSLSTTLAALYPHIPCTPPPGAVDAEHRYTFGDDVLYPRAVGLNASCIGPIAPPIMSPPTRFASLASRSAGAHTRRARTQSPKPLANRSICASSLGSMSSPHPCGTWQYAHAMCLPSGAREGSNSVGCDTSTNGRSAICPLAIVRSDAAISSIVPPRCTVAARAHSGAFHGIARDRA